MKKYASILSCAIILVCSLFFLTSCKEDDEFVRVYKVSYETNSSVVELYSQYVVEYDENSLTQISPEEYMEAQETHILSSYQNKVDNKFYINLDKQNPTVNLNTNEYVYFLENNNGSFIFYRAVCKNVEYHYLNVKIINEKQFEIQYYDGSIVTISTNFYQLEYFVN